jgi:serine protease Do
MNQVSKLSFFVFFSLVLGLVLGFLFGLTTGSAEKPGTPIPSMAPPETATVSPAQDFIKQFSEAFKQASLSISSSVVSIIAKQEIQTQRYFGFPDDAFRYFFGEDFFKRFFGTPPQQQEQKRTVRSLGSGVIVSQDGYILTNSHVVEKATELRVLLKDGKDFEAEVIGTDPPTDVAVIKIDADDLPVAVMGDSRNVSVGQWVIAVGNPFQLSHTVTAGIISATGRSSVGLAEYEDFIQTDASINPGNSGGALADLNGNVVGINTAIASPSGGNIGIGFAIPINMAKQVMDALLSEGEVTRGYIGLWLQDVTEDLAEALDLDKSEGVLVADVAEGGPADQAGIERGDVIVEADGEKIRDGAQLKNKVAMTQPGSSMEMVLIRDGKKEEVTVELRERPGEEMPRTPQREKPEDSYKKRLGVEVQALTPDIARQLGYSQVKGVVVTRVISGSPAANAGLQRGDLIQEVNRQEVESVKEFENAVKGLDSGDMVALLVRRGENTFFAALEID